MAEAAVEDSATNRFFCHKCSIEITRVLEDYTCPTCLGGFIEELDSTNSSSNESSDVHSYREMDDMFFSDYIFGRDGRDGSRENQHRDSGNPDGGSNEGDGIGRRYRNGSNLNFNLRPRDGDIFERYSDAIQQAFQEFAINMTGVDLVPMGRGNDPLAQGPGGRGNEPIGMDIFERHSDAIQQAIQEFAINMTGVDLVPMGPGGRGNEPVFFLGNPGDYAWGRGGLDAIVTRLLNQIDGTGPPPLDKEKIREIPVTVIEQEQVDSNLQCSVCWDDFKIGEAVRKLECEHFYHESCIVPWLELHGTCPICRKSLLSDQEDKPPGNTGNSSGRPNFAAVIRQAVRSRASTNLRASSSMANISSTSSTNSSNGRHPSSGDDILPFHLDFEFEEP